MNIRSSIGEKATIGALLGGVVGAIGGAVGALVGSLSHGAGSLYRKITGKKDY